MRQKRWMSIGAAVAAASIGILWMAWPATSGRPADQGEPTVTMLEDVDMSGFTLPLDEFQPTPSDHRAHAKAYGIVHSRCMRRFGFTVTAPATGAGSITHRYERRYGIVNEEQARVHGFHPPKQTPSATDRPTARSPAEIAVSRGQGPRTHQGQQIPASGCEGEAQRALAQGTRLDQPSQALPDQLAYTAFKQAEQDSRVSAVNREWNACMGRSGFDYADPLQANNDPAFAGPEPTEREIAVAVATVRCNQETGLIRIRASVELAYNRRALEQNAIQLNIVKADLAKIRTNVATVLEQR